jgi:hypothetical protein
MARVAFILGSRPIRNHLAAKTLDSYRRCPRADKRSSERGRSMPGTFDEGVDREPLAFAAGAAIHVPIGFSMAFFLIITHLDPGVAHGRCGIAMRQS